MVTATVSGVSERFAALDIVAETTSIHARPLHALTVPAAGAATLGSPYRMSTRRDTVARVIVDVMLKPEILDPQGQAIARALPRLGFARVADVRQGKRFEIEIDGPADEDEIRKMAETLLANTVIEDFTIRLEQ